MTATTPHPTGSAASDAPRVGRWRSLPAALLLPVVVVAGNAGGGELLDLAGLRGGAPRLAADLAVLALVSLAGVFALLRVAGWAPRAHAVAAGGALTVLAGWAAWTMGADFPAWFTAGVLAAQPPAAWAAWRLGAPARAASPRA